MFCKTDSLFCAVALAILLTVQANVLRATERDGMCDKMLAEACPGARDSIPFAYAPEPQKIDESCTVASAHFPCFKNYASSCESEDIESRYFLTYLDICDSSSPLYEGIRKSIKCMKIAEKDYNKTCAKPMEKLEAQLTAFESKISDHAISTDDWEKLATGLATRQEMICYLERMKECDKDTDSEDTVEELFIRFGAVKKVAFLIENQSMVNTVLDNINLDDEQKKMLRGQEEGGR